MLVWLSVWREVKWFAHNPTNANATLSSLVCFIRILSSLSFWCWLTPMSYKRGHLMSVMMFMYDHCLHQNFEKRFVWKCLDSTHFCLKLELPSLEVPLTALCSLTHSVHKMEWKQTNGWMEPIARHSVLTRSGSAMKFYCAFFLLRFGRLKTYLHWIWIMSYVTAYRLHLQTNCHCRDCKIVPKKVSNTASESASVKLIDTGGGFLIEETVTRNCLLYTSDAADE